MYYVFPVLSGILFGSAGVFIRIMTAYGFDSITIVGQRALFAVIIMAVVLLIYDKELLKIRLKDIWIFVISGVLGITVMNLCYNIALRETTMSFAAVMLSMFPVFVFIFSAFLFKEKVTRLKILCSGLAIAGCYMVSNMPGILEGVPVTKWGLIAGMLAPFFYSMYSIGARLAVNRGYEAITITFYSIFMMAIVLSVPSDWGMVIEYGMSDPLRNWTVMIAHAVCVSVLPYMLFTIGIEKIDTGKAAILSSFEPASAMMFGALFFGEMPTIVSFAGLVLATVAICLISMPERKEQSSYHRS